MTNGERWRSIVAKNMIVLQDSTCVRDRKVVQEHYVAKGKDNKEGMRKQLGVVPPLHLLMRTYSLGQ
jgi:hypothetical protein